MPALGKYSALWEKYPDYYYFSNSDEVKREIGGAVDSPRIANTCAIRLSHTLNHNGHAVPRNFPGLLTVKGGNGKRYALRVREMRKWLEFRIGKPDFDVKKKAGTAFSENQLRSMSGIIAFDIKFNNATGHLDLWDGYVFSTEHNSGGDWWTRATRISLWKALR
jgi:hypothetical protein